MTTLRKKRMLITFITPSGKVPAESILVEKSVLDQVIEMVWDAVVKFFALIGFLWVVSWLF